MRLKDISQTMDALCPCALQEDWDNSGLQVGDPDAEVKKVLVAFDFTEEILIEAEESEVQLVVTHHPFFFRGIRCIDMSEAKGRMIRGLIENRIGLISCHTNLDKVSYGVSAELGRRLGLQHSHPFIAEGKDCGFGVIGTLASPCTLGDVANNIRNTLGVPSLRMVGDESATVYTVAAMGGAGGDFLQEAKNQGADVYVTADLKYHDGQAAAEMGLALIDAGHFATEVFVMEPFRQKLAAAMPNVTFTLSERMKDFWTIR